MTEPLFKLIGMGMMMTPGSGKDGTPALTRRREVFANGVTLSEAEKIRAQKTGTKVTRDLTFTIEPV